MPDKKTTQEYTLEEGQFLVKLARNSIIHYLTFGELINQPIETPEKFLLDSGVFVTLNTVDQNQAKNLRGCIGFPLPVYPLVIAIIQAAKSAAVGDPRFPVVTIKEMKNIVVEITILTQPKELKVKDPKEYLKKVKIGRDGLIVRNGVRSGLLLPQVPIDWGWDVKEFLEHTCNKADLPKNCWKDTKTTIESFSGIIFQEEEPNGEIVQEEM
ncbi:MAG: TIGR00296 family protein [Candidatus Heimdallarchaeota archaeon]